MLELFAGSNLGGALLNATPALIGQNAQNKFNAEQAAINREFWSERGRYQRMVSMGFNPNLAAASVMGVSQSPGMPAQASSGMEALNEMQRQMYDSPAQKANINMDNSVAHYNDSMKRYIDTQNDWYPISQEAQINLWEAEKANFNHLNDYYDALGDKIYTELSLMPMVSYAEAYERYAKAKQAFADIKRILSEVGVNVEQKRLIGFQADIAEVDSYVKDVTVAYQVAFEQLKTQFQNALAKNEDWALKINEITNGLGFTGDLMLDLALISATGDDGSKTVDSIFKSMLDVSGKADDLQVEIQKRNYGIKWLMSLGYTYQDALKAFSGGLGAGLGASLTSPAGPIGTVGSAAGAVKGAGAADGAVKGAGAAGAGQAGKSKIWYDEAGRRHRIDSYGNHWLGGEIIN